MTSMSIEEAFEGLRAEVRVETVAPTAAGTVLGVVRPASTAEVQTCLRWAAQHQVPVITIGTGARLDRDVVLDGALVVSTELLTGVRTNHDGTITAWAGTRTEDVLAAVADRGEWLPLTAGPSSTIGGDIATAPGTGLPTLDLRAHLVSVQVVLADGQTVRAAGTASSGPTALGNLFVGSHGLLGVITEVTLRPTAPPDRSVALVAFDDPAVAGNAALELFFAAPSVEAQLLSRVTLSDPTSLAPGEGAVLLVSCSADDRRAVEDVGMAFGARQITVCPSGPDALLLLGASASAPAALRALGVSLGDPLAVPPTRLADFLDGVREIERDCGHQVISLVDVGIGAVQAFVLDADTATDTAEESLARLLDLACDLVQEATGAGNGRYSTAWTGRVLGGRFVESDRRMKLGLDPDGRLNPGLAY